MTPTIPTPGDIVTYDHPDWGPCRGRVLLVEGQRVLVQDLAPNGAREWWPCAGDSPAIPFIEAHDPRGVQCE